MHAAGAGSSGTVEAEEGLSEADWARLYSRVMPNPIGLDAFKTYLCEGKLQEVYLAKDLHKIVQEMRDILREHGELREAATFPTSGRKGDLARAAAAAVRVLTTRSSNANLLSSPVTSSDLPLASRGRPGYVPAMAACAATLTRPVQESASASSSLPPPLPLRAGHGRPSLRDFPFATNGTRATTSSTAPVEAQNATPHPTPSASPTRSGSGSASSTNQATVVHADRAAQQSTGQRAHSRTPPLTDAVDKADAALPASAVLSSTAANTTSNAHSSSNTNVTNSHMFIGEGIVQTSVGTANELAMLNERASPFMRILSVIRRLQLRYGSHPIRFDIPVQYAQAVNTRRLRVQLIPLRHPIQPARWPAAREVVVYVNDQCITTPWRRAWPEREQEVEKSYLVLDLTQLLVRGGAAQRLRVDIFHKDYFAAALLAVVQPLSLDEVVETVLRRVFGVSQLSSILAALTSSSATSSVDETLAVRLRENDAAVWALYARVMEEGRVEEEADGLEADDPIIATTCPVSRTPMEIPVRGAHCRHLQCVDLRSYLVSGQKACYWNCVLCDLPLRVTEVQVDTILWRYLATRQQTNNLPSYLRLAVRPQRTGSVTYEWYASPPAGASRGSLVEDDDDEDEGDGETKTSRGAQVKAEGMTDGQRDGDEAYDASYKRPREEEAQADEPYVADGGSADCPIEL